MKALVLAGGFPQIALIKELKKRGITTLLADYYEAPVAAKYADKFFRASTLDTDAIEEIAVREKVDFLITACTDQALLTVAYVSERLGLPCYIDYKTALNVTNKSYMKKVFEENGVPTARHTIVDGYNATRLEHFDFPLIVKPVDCNSSKGVKRVENHKELEKAIEKAVEYSRTNTAVVEEFIEGEELSADIYVENGKAHLLSVSSLEKIADKEKFVIFRGFYSKEKTERVRPLVEKIANDIATSFGLVNSPMLIQMIYKNGKAYVLEFSARTGGGVKYILIKNASGFDVISAVVDLTLGKLPHYEKGGSKNNFVANDFIYCKPGRFKRLEGFEELKEEGVINDYYLFKWEGAEFDTIENSGDRVGGYTVSGETLSEVKMKQRLTVERTKVLSESGEDMMRKDLLTEIKGEE